MATQQTTIFNGALTGNAENLSTQFDNGIGFYLIAPGASVEYQIDIYLQVQLSNTITRMVRLDPSNVSNTERITLLPAAIVELGLPMRLSISPSESFNLEVILLQSDCSLCALKESIETIQETINDGFVEIDNRFNNIESTLQQILTAVNTPDIPVVVPAAAQQQFFFLQ